MNVLESYTVENPFGKTDVCAKLVIYDTAEWFILSDITAVDWEYTFSAWIKSDADGSLTVGESAFSTGIDWVRYTATFTADDVDLKFIFGIPGTYYMYCSQLEFGNTATDWTPSNEDVDADIEGASGAASNAQNTANEAKDLAKTVETSLSILADSVVTLASDANGNTSILKQDGTGWTFSISDLESTVESALSAIGDLNQNKQDVNKAIENLQRMVDDQAGLQNYVRVELEDTQPYIELGKIGGDFKLRITNTEMYFMNGAMILTTVTNQKMIVNDLEVEDELQIGSSTRTDGTWIWKQRTNGNLGLVWKGVTS